MYISPKLNWLKEYFDMAKKEYPKLKKIKSIKRISPSMVKKSAAHGLLRLLEDSTYELSVSDTSFYGKVEPLSKIDILSNFAHELAHCYDMYHSPGHKEKECNITLLFMERLAYNGYINEEEELYGNK